MGMTAPSLFSIITNLRWKDPVHASAAFTISFEADADIPFPQLILWQHGRQHLFHGEQIQRKGGAYSVTIPAGTLQDGEVRVQAEGCRTVDLNKARAEDWIKAFATLQVVPAPAARIEVGKSTSRKNASGVKIYYGIHKHMHQPYYRAADPAYWDGEKDSIFGQRGGAYSVYLRDAAQQYVDAGLSGAGISTSWSGSLIEQLNRCERDGLCGGQFKGWSSAIRDIAAQKTAKGHPRVDFSAFGFFHPLMPLIPARNIKRQIEWHRRIVRDTFGVDASPVLFPPETAFHVRMIPALKEAGIKAVIYDSIHRYRTCENYPYAGSQEGMLPPNRAEQVNPRATDWYQLTNVWAGSKISPALLRPEYVGYEDVDGKKHTIIGVPAERYLGNEDARGGFGALQYPDCFGQLHREITQSGLYDPKHPPFFLLHSDGDNYGGGTDGYYRHNTSRMVQWLKNDPRFELISIQDYLDLYPPDPANTVHIEPGSWSGADNGDPQFMKWFSRYNEAYSPDLNSWAVLTALQNAVHTLEDSNPNSPILGNVQRLMLTAETSCYWYWTGQALWDQQVTDAANAAYAQMHGQSGGRDVTGPTIFPPWITPENPGGKTWGHGGLTNAARQGTVHTFVADVSGLRDVRLVLRSGGREEALPMTNHGLYPCQTGARTTAHYFTLQLPEGLGDVRYYIEATDAKGNISRGSLERVFLA